MKYLILLLFCCSYWACQKTPKSPYSEWKIGSDQFRENTFNLYSNGRSIAQLIYSDDGNNNSVYIELFHARLPTAGSYLVVSDNPLQSPGECTVSFKYKGKRLKVSETEPSYIKATEVDGKSRLTLSDTWYINRNDPTDSFLVVGTFNQP